MKDIPLMYPDCTAGKIQNHLNNSLALHRPAAPCVALFFPLSGTHTQNHIHKHMNTCFYYTCIQHSCGSLQMLHDVDRLIPLFKKMTPKKEKTTKINTNPKINMNPKMKITLEIQN